MQMTNITAVIWQIIMLFCVTAVGYLTERRGIMTEPVIKGVNTLLLRVAWPCMILMTTQKSRSESELGNFMMILAVTFAVLAAGCVIVYALTRRSARVRSAPVYTMLAVMPNAGFVGLPIIRAVYGDVGEFYLSAFLVGMNLVMWTICVFLFTGVSLHSLKAALNPGFIASVLGTALFLLGIRLPTPLASTVTQLGSMTTPLAMLLLGARLNRIRRDILRDRGLWTSGAVKLLVMPLITLVLMRLLHAGAVVTGVTVLSMAMPAASAAQLFAENYDSDVQFAAAGVSLGTL